MPPITVSDLIAYSTKKNYRIYCDRWIEPHWGHCLISEVRTVAVVQWLRQPTLDQGRKMTRGTKAKICNVMHSLFNHAIRWEWMAQNTNPIAKVRPEREARAAAADTGSR